MIYDLLCHNVTRILPEIIIKPWLYIDEHIFFPLQGFPNSEKDMGGWVGGKSPPTGVESEILLGGGGLPGGENLSRGDFDDSNNFQC